MRKLEERKYNGGHFAHEIRQLTSYFAVKHQLWPQDTEALSAAALSDRASHISSPTKSPMGASSKERPRIEDYSPSPAKIVKDTPCSVQSAKQQPSHRRSEERS